MIKTMKYVYGFIVGFVVAITSMTYHYAPVCKEYFFDDALMKVDTTPEFQVSRKWIEVFGIEVFSKSYLVHHQQNETN